MSSKPKDYYVQVLNMPAWLRATASEHGVEIDNALWVRKTPGELVERWIGYVTPAGQPGSHGQFEKHSLGDRDDVLTADKEEVFLVAPKAGYYTNLTLQDIGRFREWKEHGGPKYDAILKVNARKGELMFIGTFGCIETGQWPEQPWGVRESTSSDPDTRIADLQAKIAQIKAEKEAKLMAELAALEETGSK